MRTKATKPKISKEDPFAEDVLRRKESAEVLTQFVSTINEPFVLAIDSPWGTGKTTFIKMWQQHLKNNGYPCLYFNAWENDFCDDPFISLIGEIELGIDAMENIDKTKAQEIFKKAKTAGLVLAKRSLSAAVRLLSVGALDVDEMYEKTLAELNERYAKEEIEKYEKSKSTIDGFKTLLASCVKELPMKSEEKKPLIFFIDELDRCRPNYAIELLEKTKHIFNIDGIIFILAIDKEQIGHSISSLYGIGMNVDGYLRRFIDMDYRLPESSTEDFCKALFKRFNFEKYLSKRPSVYQSEADALTTILAEFSKIFGLTLRIQEQCFTQLSVAIKMTLVDQPLHPFLLSFLIALKAGDKNDKEKYIVFTKGNMNASQMVEYIRKKPHGIKFLATNYGWFFEACLRVSQCTKSEFVQLAKSYYDNVGGHLDQRERNIRSEIMKFSNNDYYGQLGDVVKKIEIAEQFL